MSICAGCSKKSYRTAIARSNPLQERDPELYNRIDGMSRLPLEGNQQVWDEFCTEIKAEDFYDHLPTLVEIVREGKWRTDALDAKKWLCGNLARRVKRFSPVEDYGPTGKRLPGGPKFDHRNGALTSFGIRPFTEFEVLRESGDTVSPDEVIEGQLERKRLQTAEGEDGDSRRWIMPADRDSLRFLSRRTLAERIESYRCEELAEALERDRAAFDQALTDAINAQQRLVERMELDQDEAVVVGVIELLWSVGPRMYLNFLDGPDQKRIRNAWDRLDRKRKNPDWAARFRQTLRTYANFTRAAWSHSRRGDEADHQSFLDRQGLKHLIPQPESVFHHLDETRPAWAECFSPFHCTCGALDHRFCMCRKTNGPIGGEWTGSAGISMRTGRGAVEGVVRLDCDLPPEEKRVYSAYETKRKLRDTPRLKKLYSP